MAIKDIASQPQTKHNNSIDFHQAASPLFMIKGSRKDNYFEDNISKADV
jgi:hypothetical protein